MKFLISYVIVDTKTNTVIANGIYDQNNREERVNFGKKVTEWLVIGYKITTQRVYFSGE